MAPALQFLIGARWSKVAALEPPFYVVLRAKHSSARLRSHFPVYFCRPLNLATPESALGREFFGNFGRTHSFCDRANHRGAGLAIGLGNTRDGRFGPLGRRRCPHAPDGIAENKIIQLRRI